MNIIVIGAAGMLGRKLVAAMIDKGELRGKRIERLTLADIVAPEAPRFNGKVETVAVDLSEPGIAETLVASRPDVIFHLAAIVSGEAEADFEKGYRVNLDGTRSLFEAIRKAGLDAPYCPRLVFTSSIVVFGEPLPDVIDDTHCLTPLTSYGTQKAMCELLLADYSRRGFLDGVGIRLPTISIRPGKPNMAASGFFSSILREPLVGQEAVLPVSETVRHWFASPRAAVGFMLRAAELDTARLGARRTITMPGLSATVGEQIEALRRVAGDGAASLIRREANPTIAGIIAGWPQNFSARRATELGFKAEQNFDEIIRVHIEDELGNTLPR
ncbi:SDR family oxidoreductase [Mesorhizobium sp. YC-39]|uniref:D-erythronate dehydrogenase n=1 Tax=unclassified Mesorhizobium TaxID=325217 RepID=UPI0021E7C757|nr:MULTISPECIES: D-erythronate dehydrogenase [unclassified Mesorhizobium]MCV3207181.1 SDR family oxidoreductase [Mesorhizobium sp. YC-2]MCV3228908.1 SDR family oxidoreductase [Mesorhizobium sp. YC-39]